VRYLSVCSGIEASTVAWRPLGWKAVAFAEIEKFPCAVLTHHYPDVPNLGDMAKIDGEKYCGAVDLIVGGTPCQDFSVAGKRKGMAGARGGLALAFVDLVRHVRSRWLVWENVPGVLSSGQGSDFLYFLRLLANNGYHLAWRVLDAQYFGVPQRRRRVFVVGHLGDWRPAAQVLFEPHCLRRDIAPCEGSRENVAGTIESSLGRSRGAVVTPFDTTQITSPGNFSEPKAGDPCHPLSASGHPAAIAFHGSQDPDVSGDVTHPCGRNNGLETCVAVSLRGRDGGGTAELSGEVATALRSSQGGSDKAHVLQRSTVRRLTPKECERLQGFPDDYTLIPGASDSARYKAIGNSMAVPVMRWIGRRIEDVCRAQREAR